MLLENKKMNNNQNGIYTIDSHYGRENMAAVYLIKEGDVAALVETANAYSLPNVESTMVNIGLDCNSIKYIFLTHIHLDHAGGAGVYMENFPQARLVVHPKGARHMVDPGKLEQSVIGVYGEEFVNRMYGKLKPIDQDRMLIANDNLEIMLGSRRLICRHTPGHANHHIAIFDNKAKAVFTGDVFGVCYPELINLNKDRFIFPTTTPVNFDPQLMHQSIDLINSYQPAIFYPTHFGGVTNVSRYAAILHKMVDDFVDLTISCKLEPDLDTTILNKLDAYMWQQAQDFHIVLDRYGFQRVVGMDNKISAQGLAHWLRQQNA